MATRVSHPKWLEKYGRWQWKVYRDGKARTFTCPMPGKKGYDVCEKKGKDWRDGKILDPSIKVGKFYDKWTDELRATTSESHWLQYGYFGRCYIIPTIGARKVSILNEQHLQDVLLYAFQHPAKGKTLSHKTLNDLRLCMHAFIKYARKNTLTALRPESLYIPDGAGESNRDSMQVASVKTLFERSKTMMRNKVVEEWYVHSYRYAVVTGMRPGEICGLEDSDIDGNIGTVNRSVDIRGKITKGKTKNAKRKYVIPELGLDIIRDQKLMMKKAGVISRYVFPAPDGNISSQKLRRRRWIRYAKFNGIKYAMPYEMRHTWFSMLKDIPIDRLKPMGGHGKSFDSNGTYGHELDGEALETAGMINQTFSKILKKG